MGWMDTLKEGAKEFIASDFGQDLARRARSMAEQGLDKILGTQTAGENQPVEEQEASPKAVTGTASNSDNQPDQQPESEDDTTDGKTSTGGGA